jgi:hypothetical protein
MQVAVVRRVRCDNRVRCRFEFDPEHAAHAKIALHANGPAHQSNARALSQATPAVQSVERDKQLLQLVRAYALARVLYANAQMADLLTVLFRLPNAAAW